LGAGVHVHHDDPRGPGGLPDQRAGGGQVEQARGVVIRRERHERDRDPLDGDAGDLAGQAGLDQAGRVNGPNGLGLARGTEVVEVVVGVVQHGEASLPEVPCVRRRVRKAKQFELGVLPHFPAVAVVSVPSRLPNTIWAPCLSSGRTARKYVPGSGGRSGVLPSIMSPTAVSVTEAPAVDLRGSAAARCVAALARAAGWLEPAESAAGEAAVPPGGLPKEQAETTRAIARPTNA